MSTATLETSTTDTKNPALRILNGSLLGFEAFDVLVILVQILFLHTAVRVDSFFLHPVVQFISATGFFVFIGFLGRTQQYSIGYSKIGGFHKYLHWATTLGGITGGAFMFAFVALPLVEVLNLLQLSPNLSLVFFLPLLLCSMAVIPYLTFFTTTRGSDDEYLVCAAWVHWAGRIIILLAANVILIFFWTLFAKEDELLVRAFFLTLFLASFYVPIRVQEMFLRPSGPHFQSLVQTIVILIFFGSIPPLFA